MQPSNSVHPAGSWTAAASYYEAVVGHDATATWDGELRRRGRGTIAGGGPDIRPGERGKWAYAALGRPARENAEQYLRKRVRDQGWIDDSFSSGIAALPKSTPQGHRWHLLKTHLKGHYTTDRLQKARVVEAVEPCPFGREQEDPVKHFFVCGTVRSALAEVAADATTTPPEWDIADMFMQR